MVGLDVSTTHAYQRTIRRDGGRHVEGGGDIETADGPPGHRTPPPNEPFRPATLRDDP
jgi:hypothetical protein